MPFRSDSSQPLPENLSLRFEALVPGLTGSSSWLSTFTHFDPFRDTSIHLQGGIYHDLKPSQIFLLRSLRSFAVNFIFLARLILDGLWLEFGAQRTHGRYGSCNSVARLRPQGPRVTGFSNRGTRF